VDNLRKKYGKNVVNLGAALSIAKDKPTEG